MKQTPLRPQVSPAVRPVSQWRLVWVGLLPLLAAALSTCGPKAGCLTSTGPIVTERRELPATLRDIYTYDNVDLILVQDAPGTPFAEVRAGKNLIAGIQTRMEGRALSISNTATCNWVRAYDQPLEVTLHLPRFTNVFLRGIGNIRTKGQFVQDTLFFHLTGSGNIDLDVESAYLWGEQYELGDVTVRGRTGELLLTVGGNGRFFGQGLRAGTCYFKTNRGANGDAHIRATDLLSGSIRGNGTVYYYGQPGSVGIERIGGDGRPQQVP
jgi:hypothetical protein